MIKNKEKYIGKRNPVCRSSWENIFCIFCDNHPSISQWASEPFSIPYRDPILNKARRYWPDFLIIYIDKDGQQHAEVVEIKPAKQAGRKKTKSLIDQAQWIRNQAKWVSAKQWCSTNGMAFRVITDLEMFKKGTK